MIALAIFFGFLVLAAVAYRLGTRRLDLLQAEIDGRPVPRRRKKRPASRRSAEEPDQDEEDDEAVEAEGFAAAVREVDQLDQIAKQAWIDQQLEAGVEREEIDRQLRNREPVAQLHG